MLKHTNAFFVALTLTAASAHGMQIFLIEPSGRTVTIDVDAGDTIDNVKQKYQDKEGIEPDRQALFFLGLELEDGGTLADYGVQKDASVQVFYTPINLGFGGPLAWTGADTLTLEFTQVADAIRVSRHRIEGSLDLSGASSASPIVLNLVTPFDALPSFDPAQDYAWTFLDDSLGNIVGFAPDKFQIDTSGFDNDFNGTWSVSEGSLVLNYAPIPESASLPGLAGLLAASSVLLRRRPRRLS